MTIPLNAIGSKMNNRGEFIPFEGISLISIIDRNSTLFKCINRFQEAICNSQYGRCFSFLPPDSFHITIMDLLCSKERTLEKWSTNYDLHQDVIDIGTDLFNKLSIVVFPNSIRFGISNCQNYDITLKVSLTPSDHKVKAELETYRDIVSKITGIRHSNHSDYKYHVSLAYTKNCDIERTGFLALLKSLESDLFSGIISIPVAAPEIVYFPDMTTFTPIKKVRQKPDLYQE